MGEETGPRNSLNGINVLFCVSGGIAAYKAAAAVSGLRQRGARVRVVMTEAAAAFVSPLTFQAVSGNPVMTDLFAPQTLGAVDHVELAHESHVGIVAPATANTIAKLSLGIADDAVTTILAGSAFPVVVAPAMEPQMLANPATREHLTRLAGRGWHVLPTGDGHLASGRRGPGRMAEPEELVAAVERAAALPAPADEGDLAGRVIMVSAGPTREYADPVRFLSNPSTGRMGYALAEAARDRGARVILVSGPVPLDPPRGMEVIAVETAVEMHRAVMSRSEEADAIIMAAAVSDYRPVHRSRAKMKKGPDSMVMELTKNPDILADLGRRRREKTSAGGGEPAKPALIGFAAESHDAVRHGREKLMAKGADLIVVNDITEPGSGFGTTTNTVIMLHAGGGESPPVQGDKKDVAHRILDKVKDLLPTAGAPGGRPAEP